MRMFFHCRVQLESSPADGVEKGLVADYDVIFEESIIEDGRYDSFIA